MNWAAICPCFSLSAWSVDAGSMLGIVLCVGAVLWATSVETAYLWGHWRPPGPPLHDVVHAVVPADPAWEAYRVPDALLAGVLLCTLGPLWHRERATLRRILREYVRLMACRLVLLACTRLPDPSRVCATGTLRPGQTCGDMMYSGHTVAFVLAALSWRDLELGPGGMGVQAACALGMVSLVVLRVHYTVDVLVAAALTVSRWDGLLR